MERGVPGVWTEDIESAVRVVGMRGELDAATAGAFRSEIQGALGAGCAVIIDLTETVYFDSVGLTAMIEAWQLAGSRSLGLALVVGEPVRSKFHMRGVESFLPLVPDRDAALAQVRRA